MNSSEKMCRCNFENGFVEKVSSPNYTSKVVDNSKRDYGYTGRDVSMKVPSFGDPSNTVTASNTKTASKFTGKWGDNMQIPSSEKTPDRMTAMDFTKKAK